LANLRFILSSYAGFKYDAQRFAAIRL